MKFKIVLAALMLAPGLATAQEFDQQQLQELLGNNNIRWARHMGFNPQIVRAVETQNAVELTLDEIKRRDQEWRQADPASSMLIQEVTQNEVARYFRRRVEDNPSIFEVFLTDNQGANVAAYPPTSDYWQGDEEKFSNAWNGGQGQLFIGPPEFDESTNKTQIQISTPVISGYQTVGVLVMGVAVDALISDE
ncbi:MAG TPA: PDC sensor domain-containing protein [Gammaproteobacteria bacterium]|jgi:hypothetical protein